MMTDLNTVLNKNNKNKEFSEPSTKRKPKIRTFTVSAKALTKNSRSKRSSAKPAVKWRKQDIILGSPESIKVDKTKKAPAKLSTWKKYSEIKREPTVIVKKDIVPSKTTESKNSIQSENDFILKMVELYNRNFCVATSNICYALKNKYSVEDVKDLFYKQHPELKKKTKFDFSYEKMRKAELERLHSRSSKTEARILELCSEQKALRDELTKRKTKEQKIKTEKEKYKKFDFKQMSILLSKIPEECKEIALYLPSSKVFLTSSLLSLNFNLSAQQKQNLNDYLFSMLNYNQTEPVTVMTMYSMKLWNTLAKSILIMQNLQSKIKLKKRAVSDIEASLLTEKIK